MSDPTPISWRAVVYGTPVVSTDGSTVGDVRELLGSDAEDIFHGLRVALGGGHPDVVIDAADVDGMTTVAVTTSLTKAEVDALPPYDEQSTYHLASVGWLRKHLGWKKDSKSDEEA